MLREIMLLHELKHEHVIDMMDVFTHNGSIHLVFEFCTTDLEAIVKEIVEGGGGGFAGSGVTYSVEFSDGVLADGVPADRISDLGEAQVADSANGVRSNHDGTSG